MSIRHYCGEYLVNPAPLHMGLNWCSHACFYCFANLNRPDRRADYGEIKAFLARYARRAPGKDIGTWLALQGHPIVCANDSDPFSESNNDQNLELIQHMQDAGLRFCFQTRGGRGAEDILALHPPTMVYISFTTDQEETRARAEPGAPTHKQRLQLARHAKACGHFVVAGINPFYPVWWDDIHGFIARLADLGIHHAWIGEPHLNYMQVNSIAPRIKARFAEEIVYFSATPGRRSSAVPGLRNLCRAHGINTFFGSTSDSGNFWQPYFDLGYPQWPTLEGWFDHLRASGTPAAFTFDAFHEWADRTQGFTSSQFKEYLSGIGRSIRDTGAVQQANTLREVHQFLWRIHEFPTRLRHDDLFLGTQDGQLAVDEQGRSVLVYAPGITDPAQGRFDIDQCEAWVGFQDQD